MKIVKWHSVEQCWKQIGEPEGVYIKTPQGHILKILEHDDKIMITASNKINLSIPDGNCLEIKTGEN